MPDRSIFPLLLILYSLSVGAGAWFVLRTERRRQLQQRFKSTSSGLTLLLAAVLSGWRSGLFLFRARTTSVPIAAIRRVRHQKKAVLIGILLVLTPAVFALLSASDAQLDGYGDTARDMDPVVLALLQGERLAPPSALPPELFATPEIGVPAMNLADANRDWQKLDPDFRQRLLTAYRLMATQGYQMALVEGYRSPERQTVLASYGPHVTGAGAYQSYHQYGLAADSAFYKNGKLVISEKDPWAMEGYRLFGEYAESVGLVWGGRWKMRDLGHVEMRKARIFAKT
jgi:peptidoglycan L-alanyl-D-glutamate endopeptidase CwlK